MMHNYSFVYRHHNLERHLLFEKCETMVVRRSLFDLAKMKYASLLEEGAGVIPTLTSTLSHKDATSPVLGHYPCRN